MNINALSLGLYMPKLINTAISAFVIIMCMVIIYQLFKRKFYTTRKRRQFRYRVAYLGILIFILVLTRVWVDGFTHIFTMLSLVAAGLIVTNKESIMNITGWLIINWRGVFSEGDYIQVQNMVGYIGSIRVFHFKVYACQSLDNRLLTGKVIKIPNSTVITTPITLFSIERHFTLKSIAITIDLNKQSILMANDLLSHTQSIWLNKYNNNDHFKHFFLKNKNISELPMQSFKPTVQLTPLTDKELKLCLTINVYCIPEDEGYFEQSIMNYIINREPPAKLC